MRPDEAVAYEFAKVFYLYDAKLGIGDRCAIEVFIGPHTINGKGTFAFLHKHLKWPENRLRRPAAELLPKNRYLPPSLRRGRPCRFWPLPPRLPFLGLEDGLVPCQI